MGCSHIWMPAGKNRVMKRGRVERLAHCAWGGMELGATCHSCRGHRRRRSIAQWSRFECQMCFMCFKTRMQGKHGSFLALAGVLALTRCAQKPKCESVDLPPPEVVLVVFEVRVRLEKVVEFGNWDIILMVFHGFCSQTKPIEHRPLRRWHWQNGKERGGDVFRASSNWSPAANHAASLPEPVPPHRA